MTHSDLPIVCMLTGAGFRERARWLQELVRDGLLRHERDDLTLALHYRAEVRDRVLRMVARESECCAFLQFETCDRGDEVDVTVGAPESARPVVDSLFELFTHGSLHVGTDTHSPSAGDAEPDAAAHRAMALERKPLP